ncbi:MAG: hypothetical protein V1773_18765 [bacterium]
MSKVKLSLLFICVIVLYVNINAQLQDTTKKYITVIPAKEYEAGWLFKIFFGQHWRQLWTIPIDVEVINLNTFGGGLTPLEKGGGFQTKSLKFKGADGNIWKFRSVRKDPSKVLPEELQETVAADIMFDQISSSNPFAALVVVPILNKLGILQAEPKIVWLSDDERLGEFRTEFANMLGLIEIHPNENELDTTLFNGADKIAGTYNLLNRLEEKRNEKVNSKNYLTARLLDAFLGDWDRHTDQWRWARVNDSVQSKWFPIPRDRDQAFALFDGLFPNIAAMFVRQLNSFGDSYPNAEFLSWSGRVLDNRFLPELSKTEWDSVTNVVISLLTDSLIEYSVKQLPELHYKAAGQRIINLLKSRRDLLFNYSDEYFNWIHKVIEIYATVKDDNLFVNRLNDSLTQIVIAKKNKNKSDWFYNVTFENKYCDEFRIFLLEGNDKAFITGNVNSGPLVRIIGGEGKDMLVDSSEVKGYLFSILPIRNSENKVIFYDGNENTKIIKSCGTEYDNTKTTIPTTDEERFEPTFIQRGYDLFYIPNIEYNRNNGLIIGIGPEYSSYNFRMDPYEYQLSLSSSYATIPDVYHLVFNGIFNNIIKNVQITFDIFRTKLLLTNYYGYGNSTSYNHDFEEQDFYKTNQEVNKFDLGFGYYISTNLSAKFALNYQNLETYIYNTEITRLIPDNMYGLGNFRMIKSTLNVKFDSRDNKNYTQSGLLFNMWGSYYPKVFENKDNFAKGEFDISFYQKLPIFNNTILALRTGGAKIWGNYPFFEACFVGGKDNLRSYVLERFSGDASLYFQSELRIPISKVKIIIKGDLGLITFLETGRVFEYGLNTDIWHPSYGGGVWLSFFKGDLNFVYNIGYSKEIIAHYFQTKFGF